MNHDRILSMLGLAKRAGKIADGQFQTEAALKQGKAFLVIVAEDASENTRKKFSDMSSYRKVPFYLYSDRERLGRSIGCELRSCAAVTDASFAGAIEKQLKEK